MTDPADDAIKIYKQLATYPTVKYGRISMEDTPGHLQVYSEWTQRDLERSETLKFARSHVVQLDVVVPTLPHVIHDELWNKESPSGRSATQFLHSVCFRLVVTRNMTVSCGAQHIIELLNRGCRVTDRRTEL